MRRLVPFAILSVLLVGCASAGSVPQSGPAAQSFGGRGSGPAEPARDAVPAGDRAALVETKQAPTVPVPQAFESDRQLILTANIALRAEDSWATADRAQAIAIGLGGHVLGLSQSGSAEQRSATLTVRVPAARFNDALRELRSLDAEVVSSGVEGKDVTEQFVDLEARLRAKQAEEQRYLALLARAERIEDILRIDQSLSSVRTQIEQLTGTLNSIRQRTQFSTIVVSVSPKLAGVTPVPGGAWDPAKTFERALATLGAALRVVGDAAIWLIVFGWVPLVGLAIAFALARGRTRPVTAA